jgi:hypothetical protein
MTLADSGDADESRVVKNLPSAERVTEFNSAKAPLTTPRNVVKMDIDYYLVDHKPAPPSVRLRRKNEETRQSTSENRFHELHLTTYPSSLNGEKIPKPLSRDGEWRVHHRHHTPRLNYPALRTTNQAFAEAMLSAYEKLHFSPSRPFLPGVHAVASTNPSWTERDRADVLAAKTLPYDSTVTAAVGPLRTAYRDGFCRNAHPEEFQGQIVFNRTLHTLVSPRHTAIDEMGPALESVQESRVADAPTAEAATSTKNAQLAFTHPAPPARHSSPRSTPRSTRPDDREFAPFSQSYFTNKARYTLT